MLEQEGQPKITSIIVVDGNSHQRDHRSSGIVRLGEYDNNIIYFGVTKSFKKCASCNRKTCFYFWTLIEIKARKVRFGWRRCFRCLSDVERARVRELYPIVREIGVRP